MSTEELKLCAFCGETIDLHVHVYPDDAYVQCGECTTCGPDGGTREGAIIKWNTRAAALLSTAPDHIVDATKMVAPAAVPRSTKEQAVVQAARQWWCERSPKDWDEAALAKAVIHMDGDWPGCEGCDHECDEPCMPATVQEQLHSVDCHIAQLVHEGKLLALNDFTPPQGWKPHEVRPSSTDVATKVFWPYSNRWALAVDQAMVNMALDCTMGTSDPKECVDLLVRHCLELGKDEAQPVAAMPSQQESEAVATVSDSGVYPDANGFYTSTVESSERLSVGAELFIHSGQQEEQVQRGTLGDGSPWMGTLRELMEDYKQATAVEAAERKRYAKRVRRLEKLLDSARNAMERAIGKGDLCGWPEWERLLNACAAIDAAHSKRHGK